MARRILGFMFVALSAAMVRRILGFLLLSPHNLVPGERMRQRSYLKPWCVVFWALWLSCSHNLISGEKVRQRSYLKPWRVAFWASLSCLPISCFRV